MNKVKDKKLPGRVPVAKAAGQKALTEPSGSDRPTYTGGAPNTTHASATDDLGEKYGKKKDLASGSAMVTGAGRADFGKSVPTVRRRAAALHSVVSASAGAAECRVELTRCVDVESATSDSDGSTVTRPRDDSEASSDGPSFKEGRKRLRRKDESSTCSSEGESRPASKVRAGKSGRGRSTPAVARDKFGRFLKRKDEPEKPLRDSDGGSEGTIHVVPKLTDDRARERPPTMEACFGLARAKAALVAAERAAMELQAEKEVAEAARADYLLRPPRMTIEVGPTAEDLRERVNSQVGLINLVAAKSSNLKGTFVRTLKEAAATIRDAVEALSQTSASVETRKLSKDNERLRAEVAELRGELAALRADLRRPQQQLTGETTPSLGGASLEPERLQRTIIEAVGVMISARFEALEGRLLPEKRLRPPLASDRVHPDETRTVTQPATPVQLEDVAIADPSPPTTQGKAKRKGKKKKTVVSPNPDETPHPLPATQEWTVVTRRKPKSGKGPGPAAQPKPKPRRKPKPKPKQKPKLRPPSTSAVVLKLRPDAEARGVTYARVLTQAKKAVDLGSLGIQSLGFKRAATGARILVLPGATSSGKADLLATKLKEALKEEDVQVSRPEKCATLRISGLDDSVGQFEVMAEVSRIGECPPSSMRVGEVRRARSGLGTLLVSCPVGAAKKVMGLDRLFIGWSTVHRTLLDTRPLRCFKCLNLGHVREQCTAEVDYGNICFRCGKPDHKSGGCAAAPHCVACAAAKQPAGHKMGGRVCARAKPARRKGRKAATRPTAQSRPAHPAAAGEAAQEISMATT